MIFVLYHVDRHLVLIGSVSIPIWISTFLWHPSSSAITDLTVLHLVQISPLHLFSFIQYWYYYSKVKYDHISLHWLLFGDGFSSRLLKSMLKLKNLGRIMFITMHSMLRKSCLDLKCKQCVIAILYLHDTGL